MSVYYKRIIPILLSAIAVGALLFLGCLGHAEKQNPPSDLPLDWVAFIGERRIDGQTAVFTGHFDRDIPRGQQLLLRMKNIRVKIFQNEKQIYEYGMPGTYPSISKSPGNTWNVFEAPGITSQDLVRIELENIYTNNVSSAYDDFIEQILEGDSGVLLSYMLRKTGFTILGGGIVFLAGCILILAGIILRLLKTSVSFKVLYFAAFSIVSGLWFVFDFRVISLVIPCGVFGNIISMICLCLAMPLFGLYVRQFVESRTGVLLEIFSGLQLLFAAFYIVVQWMGIYDGFELLSPLIVLMVSGFLCTFGVLIYETFWKKRQDTSFLLASCGILLLIGVDIKEFIYDFTPTYAMTKISYCLFISVHFLYMIRGIQISIEGLRRASRLEDELAQSRITIAISQIQPHFLYNTLTAIKQLCAVDPKRAERAVGDFSSFLRGNLDSLTGRVPISFEKELSHIRNYLALEQLRFGSRLSVDYDVQVTDFKLPSLTVQPLVENAVRYGVTKRAQGGVVTISTREEEGCFLIVVADDGVGFDTQQQPKDGRSHIGIENVRSRLAAQCGGRLIIESQPGQGTAAAIILKK